MLWEKCEHAKGAVAALDSYSFDLKYSFIGVK